MKTSDFKPKLSSKQLKENMGKMFGMNVAFEKYTREQLEDMRNKLRTKMFQQEGQAGFNDLLTNETYQKDKAMLALLNTRIKEMLGEDIAKLRDKLAQLDEAKKGVKAPKFMKHAKGSKGTGDDKTGDGKKDFDDVQVARMVAGGVPKQKAIAKATGDQFKEAAEDRPPAEKKAGTWTDKSGKQHPATKVRGSKTIAGDKEAAKARKSMDKDMNEAADEKCNHTPKGKKCPVHGLKECGTMKEGMKMVKGPNGKMVPAFAADGKGKKDVKKNKMDEANSIFRRHVKIVNESLAHLIQEDEEGKAKAITAAGDIVNDYTSWMQRVGQYQTKSMIELADAIRADFGTAEAEAFKQAVAPALAATLETLMAQREAISNAVAVLAGEAAPTEPMGMEPEMGPEEPGMDMAEPDAMNEPPADEFAATDAAAGAGTPGREMRESQFARKLAESHSIISKLAR